MSDKLMMPWGIYDTKKCGLAYIGLHSDGPEAWRVYLGWPDDAEIADAKARGLIALPLTVSYDPKKVSA